MRTDTRHFIELRVSARERGFGLMEVMVAIVIGMLGTVAALQLLVMADRQARSTTRVVDAQASARLGLYVLERDLLHAGLGISRSGYFGCRVTAFDSGRSPSDYSFDLAPIQIVQGAAGAPDTIVSLWADSTYMIDPITITGSSNENKEVANRAGFSVGDFFIAAQTGATNPECAMFKVTALDSARRTAITHGSGDTGRNYNRADGVYSFTGGVLQSLGPAPRLTQWGVANGRLVGTSVIQLPGRASASAIAENVVNLQAQYGYDADGDGQLAESEWIDVLPASPNWSRVSAVRFAVLARADHLETERSRAMEINPRWAGGTFTMTNVDGTIDSGATASDRDPNNWRNYRHRVYESVVPLRNVLWAGTP